MSSATTSTTTPYEPPKQSGAGQFVDSIILILLLFVVLFGVTYYTQASGGSEPPAPKPISQLPITSGEKAAFQRLVDNGVVDETTASNLVLTQPPTDNKYPIDLGQLLLTFGVIIFYMAFVYILSLRQYKDVINEKFGPPGSEGGSA